MPSYKWTGSNEQGFVTMGGKKFEAGVPVEVDDPALGAKLDGNGEFEQVSGAVGTEAPLFSPPGPTGIGTGPGTGPYQTTNEVIDENPVEGAGQKTQEELDAEQAAADEDAGPEEPPVTEEGPKRKGKKASSEPPAESA
jgi:hypothetical protein